jgi:hypothetical protein
MAVTFDLGGARTVNGLILSPGESAADYPESFAVETSRDGATWEPAASAEQYLGGLYHMDRLRWARDGMVSAHFPPREASRVRVSLLHRREDRRWSVARAWVELAGG